MIVGVCVTVGQTTDVGVAVGAVGGVAVAAVVAVAIGVAVAVGTPCVGDAVAVGVHWACGVGVEVETYGKVMPLDCRANPAISTQSATTISIPIANSDTRSLEAHLGKGGGIFFIVSLAYILAQGPVSYLAKG